MAMSNRDPKGVGESTSTICESPLAFADKLNLERELGQMLNKLCGNKKAKLCKELGISEKQNGLETNVFLLWINA